MITMPLEKVGRYEILETLGRGAMGVVYLARDPIIDRRVALKTLRVDLDAEYADEFRERFTREARAAGRLNHPGIVTIHDVGEDPESGLVYIAMEFIEGRDLKQILASGTRLRPSEVARIAADVALALDYAHSMGVVHRDIKPANIILTQDGTAKIMDFGVARLEASNLTVDGQFIGTPNFMSPEQVTGRPVDGRSDLFSLGVVMFTLLTGKRPFTGETMHEVTLRIVQEPCPIPSTLRDDLPAALNPIVLKCLEKNPDRRFQTGGALAQVLAALARSLVQREPGDPGRTGVHQPDLETRIHVAQRAREAAAGQTAEELVKPWRLPAWLRIRLPDFMFWEVQSRWAWSIIAAAGLVLVLTALGLRLRMDLGPFEAPSEGTIKNLDGVVLSLWTARDRLSEGNLAEAESAIRAALDQAPTSPAARRIAAAIRHAIEVQRTSEENQARVADLVAEGRRLYRNGSYASAAERFRQALDLDSQNEIAVSYLELAEEKVRSTRRRTSSASTTRPGRTESPVSTAQPTPSPAPGIARITLVFDSPISAGTISVALDGESLAEVPFDFSHTGFLGFKRKGRGTVKRVILTPSGRRTVGVRLTDSKSGPLGSATFANDLPPGSEWTLRVDLPSSTARPSFFLVPKANR